MASESRYITHDRIVPEDLAVVRQEIFDALVQNIQLVHQKNPITSPLADDACTVYVGASGIVSVELSVQALNLFQGSH